MTIWNLREFSELEPPVMGRFQKRQTRQAGQKGSITSLRARFRITASIAVAGVSLMLSVPTVSSGRLVAPVASPSAVAQSFNPPGPPLDRLFGQRFSQGWTSEAEETALAALAETHTQAEARYEEEEFLDVALANQQESFAEDVPRLSREQVRDTLRNKRRLA